MYLGFCASYLSMLVILTLLWVGFTGVCFAVGEGGLGWNGSNYPPLCVKPVRFMLES